MNVCSKTLESVTPELGEAESSVLMSFFSAHCEPPPTRWAPTSYQWSYNPYKSALYWMNLKRTRFAFKIENRSSAKSSPANTHHAENWGEEAEPEGHEASEDGSSHLEPDTKTQNKTHPGEWTAATWKRPQKEKEKHLHKPPIFRDSTVSFRGWILDSFVLGFPTSGLLNLRVTKHDKLIVSGS